MKLISFVIFRSLVVGIGTRMLLYNTINIIVSKEKSGFERLLELCPQFCLIVQGLRSDSWNYCLI